MNTLHGQLDPWGPEDLAKIHQASLSILETTGVLVGSDEVLDLLETTDARVDRDARVVRFPPEMVEQRLRGAPGSWDRAPGRPGEFSVSADCGSYYAWDYATGRARPAGPRDFVDAPRLVQAMEHVDGAGALICSNDVPAAIRDLIVYRHMWNNTTKQGGGGLGRAPSCCHSVSPRTLDYLCDMLEVKIGRQKMESDPQLSFFMGSASPLRWGRDVLEMALHAVRRGQVVGIGGNCIAGMQSPITPAANVAVDHAERLSGMCIVTSMRRDAKFYFCNHTYLLDMRSGDIDGDGPEQTLTALLGQKVLRHCGFQIVVNHPILETGSHVPDGQVAAEKMMYMLLTALGGAKGIGGAGQLKESFCYEQLAIDNELAGYVKHLLRGAAVTDETICLDTIRELGIGAEFLTCGPTLKHLRQCYHPPQLFYRKRMSEWLGEGAGDLLSRAHEKVERILSSPTPTFLSGGQLETMDEIIREACRDLAPDWDPTPYLDGAARDESRA